MDLNILLLRRKITTSLDFNQITDFIKTGTKKKFKSGLITDEVIKIYFNKDGHGPFGDGRIPYCQIIVYKSISNEITFKIADFALILFALLPIVFMLIFHFTDAPIPIFYTLYFYPFLYLMLMVRLDTQFDSFKTELNKYLNNLDS